MKWITFGCLASLYSAAFGQSFALANFDAKTNEYSVWHINSGSRQGATLRFPLAGKIEQQASAVNDADGSDAIGAYHETSFSWNEGGPVRGTIRAYKALPVVWFRLHYGSARNDQGVVFPNFNAFPKGLSHFGYKDMAFAPITFSLPETSTPWVFCDPGKDSFDGGAGSFVISPASGFMVAKMIGDGVQSIGRGLNLRLKSIPAGYDQDTLFAYSEYTGVGDAMTTWGAALRALYHRPATNYEADVLLQKFGYWTDNGADYYYNYEPDKGYAGTLVDLKKWYDEEHIPIAYMQLDSWWYPKTVNNPEGKPGGATKNSKLPAETWNRYGGLMEYRASPDLFPRGLSVFRSEVGVPFAVHNRWVDRTSPYQTEYKISGVGVVDPRFWNDIAGYLKANGVTTYEQDWLSAIYANSPEMASSVDVGDDFAEGMANACAAQGLTMQYCMATPRFFLEGVKFPNLTTIRTSGDRFEPRKWANFLFDSQLATAVGIAPWCDVFKSGELGNMTLAVLSCGPVGTGDAIGKENVANIQRAVLPDGTIVKPDSPLLPTDQTYLDQASGSKAPFVATTTTEQGFKTAYIFAFARKDGEQSVRLNPDEILANGQRYVPATRVYLFDLINGRGDFVAAQGSAEVPIDQTGYAYELIAPVSSSGIVLLGDLSKLVPTGRQRISKITDRGAELEVEVQFAKGETMVTISGVGPESPVVKAESGSLGLIRYNLTTGRFEIDVHPGPGGSPARILVRAHHPV